MVGAVVALCFLAGLLGARLLDQRAPASVGVVISFCVVVLCITTLTITMTLAD